MEIVYVFYNDWSISHVTQLRSKGINVEEGYGRIELVENEKNKPILEILEKWEIQKFVGTTYDNKDIARASLFVYVGAWENGYPMPDNDARYLQLTYNTDDYCEQCGIGKRQKAPFRVKTQPKWGAKSMFELNWILDEIFVRKEVYESVFSKKNIGFHEVLLYKNDTVIDNTIQLDIPIIDTPLKVDDHPYEICDKCKRKKYSPQIKGFFPSFKYNIPPLEIFKSKEYFGSGGEAHNKIFISKNLWKELKLLNIKPKVWPII